MNTSRRQAILPLAIFFIFLGIFAFWIVFPSPTAAPTFDGQRAHQHVVALVNIGPRIPGTETHQKAIEYITQQLQSAGWNPRVIESQAMGHPIKNILATHGETAPKILIGAHYDSRIYADNDPDPAKHTEPVPGANDGASGVGLLLELARVLPKDGPDVGLVFFDAEDNGNIETWDWILGSRAFVEGMDLNLQAFVLVDMIGDADLNIHRENNSNPILVNQIWKVAERLGYSRYFLPDQKYTILDDHVPFMEKGIRAVDLIDMDYAYWHTTADTPDKVSPNSLKIVGDVLLTWIKEYQP